MNICPGTLAIILTLAISRSFVEEIGGPKQASWKGGIWAGTRVSKCLIFLIFRLLLLSTNLKMMWKTVRKQFLS